MRKEVELLVDLDGVLADFVAGIKGLGYDIESMTREELDELKKVFAGKEFFKTLPLMEDAFELWDAIKHLDPVILTAVGKNDTLVNMEHKKEWVELMFGPGIKFKWVTRSWEKGLFAHENAILIDDRFKSLDPFIEAGGTGILHESAEKTVVELTKLNII